MMRPRKISAMRFMSSRSFCPARTLISISSRSMCSASERSTTFTTSISLFSCLVICSTTSSEPEVTMVMRDIEASSVGATVSDSMLEPREIRQRVHVGLGIAVAMEELLPLAHHAHVLVVEIYDFEGQAILLAGRELLYAHLDRRLAGDTSHRGAGIGELHAHRRRQAE